MGLTIPFQLRRGARCTLRELDLLLDRAYGTPEADLDNKDDPLDEAVYIVLSLQTNLERLKVVWKKLRSTFPDWEFVANAPLRHVVEVLRVGG